MVCDVGFHALWVVKYDDKLLYNDKLWSVMQGNKLYFNRLIDLCIVSGLWIIW